jgi:hypothetical protein
MYDKSGKLLTIPATISSCSISCLVFPCRRGEGAGGAFAKETDFETTGFATGAATEADFGAGAGESKNEKSADAHGSVLLFTEVSGADGAWAVGSKNELDDIDGNALEGTGSDFESNEFLGLGTSISSKLIADL